MYDYNDIKTVHLEITEKCNAACPMCARNINGGEDNPWLQNAELSLNDIVTIFPDTFIQRLNHMFMCGNYGDPIVAKDTLKVFKHFRSVNPTIYLSMNTNGSARTTYWWKELAEVIGTDGYVIFSIDGLEDTNYLYRKNTIWDKIMENAGSFIDAGGIAHWEYIVFEHNEHQVQEAKRLSEQMGFQKFQVKTSSRFFSSVSGSTKTYIKTIDRHGSEIVIREPRGAAYDNLYTREMSSIAEEQDIIFPTKKVDLLGNLNPELFNPHSKVQQHYDSTPIKCKVKEEKSIYVSAEGILQPCCWVAGQMYNWYHTPKGSQIWSVINKVGKDKINALNYTIEEILENNYFNLIEDSWEKTSCNDGKLQVCAKTCGLNDAFTQQYL
jgi:MoaA/NifB/PqqE/SkfB family radical SAM enzyme|tara:strand:- start:1697 stop:2839 length:1143 start_codon:yes stop_codon:yes gene_type:complete